MPRVSVTGRFRNPRQSTGAISNAGGTLTALLARPPATTSLAVHDTPARRNAC